MSRPAEPTDLQRRVAAQISDEIGGSVSWQFVASVQDGTAEPVLADTLLARRVRNLLRAG